MSAPPDLPWTVWAVSLVDYRPMLHRSGQVMRRASREEAGRLGLFPKDGDRVTVWTTACGVAMHGWLEEPPFNARGNGKYIRSGDRGASIASRHAVEITAARWCRRCWPESSGSGDGHST